MLSHCNYWLFNSSMRWAFSKIYQRFKLEVSKIESLIYFLDVDSPIFDDSNWYCRLMGELLYLTIPHVDIAFIVGLLR